MDRREKISLVLKQVSDWGPEDREALAMELLRSSRTPKYKDTLSRALGLFKTDGPPPTDDEIKRILEEARVEKYLR